VLYLESFLLKEKNMRIKKTGTMQKIVCSLFMLMYTAAAETVAYNEYRAHKELKEINKKYPLYTIQESFLEAIQHPKWYNAANYLLAENIVDINGLDGKVTFLGLASYPDNEQAVRLLLDNKAGVNRRDCFMNTPLLRACWGCEKDDYSKSRYSVIKLLLEKGADANIQNERGETALMEALKSAVYYGPQRPILEKIIKVLHRGGADIYLQDRSGVSALDIAGRKMFGSYLEKDSEEAKNRAREYKFRANLVLKSLLDMYCRLDEVKLADIITGYVGEIAPPLDWEIGMPVIKQPEKAWAIVRQAEKISECVIS